MKILSENRRARFDYEILEKFESGIELLGHEVKSVKKGQFNLSASHALVKNGEAWLIGADIPAYQPKNAPADYDPSRSRKLLLRLVEIKNLSGRLHEKGLSLIPLNAHLSRNFIKLELGLVRSKKKHDKRETLKKKTIEKEMRRRQ